MRILTSFILFLLSVSQVHAQCPVVSFEDVVGAKGDTVAVEMTLSGISSFVGFQGTVTYDPSILSLVSTEKGDIFIDSYSVNSNEPFFGAGQIIVIGLDLTPSNLTYDFGESNVVMTLFFVIEGDLGASSDIIFDDSVTAIQFVDGNDANGPCEIVNGSVTVDDKPLLSQSCPIIVIEDQTGATGDTIGVNMFFSGIDPLLAFQGTIVYDPSVLSFISLEDGTDIDSEFSLSYNEPFFASGQIVIVGLDSLLQNKYDFDELGNIARLNFVLTGAAGTSSDIAFTGQLAGIEFTSSVEEGPVGSCDIINGSISISGMPPPPPNDFEVSTTVTDALCNQTTLGSITATGLFGVPPYTFSWTGANNFTSNQSTITELLPGFYNLTATDSNNATVVIDGIEIQEVGGGFDINSFVQQNYCDTGMLGDISTSITSASVGGPFTFDWSNGATTQRISNLSNGLYTLTVTDNVGCTQVYEFEIFSRGFLLDFETNFSCEGESTGSIYAIDLLGNLTFNWSTGAVTDSIENLAAGTYEVTVEEPQGCQLVATFELGEMIENSDLILDATCSSLGQNNGSISPSFIGDLAGTSIDLEVFDAAGLPETELFDLAPGTYNVMGTSINGCTYQSSATIEESLSDYTADYYSCMLDSIQFETSSNNPNLLYSWSPDTSFVIDSVSNPIFLDAEFANPNFTATLLTSGAAGCTRSFDFNVIQQDACVWPGDTNEDNMVSAADLLHIGIANGDAGPTRPEPNVTEWFTQPATLWNENIGTSPLDKMFADCNGDGLINDADILVVSQNNGLMHLNFTNDTEVDRAMGVPLFVDLEPNYLDNVEYDINVVLGEVDDQALSAYGIAFQIKYDPTTTIISAGSFQEQGWLSEDSSVTWDIDFMGSDLGLLDVAVTRTNGTSLDGFGPIATFKSTFIGDLKSEIEFEIINAILITADAVDIPVLAMESSSVIGIGTSSASTLQADLFNESIFPNPTSDYIHVNSDRTIENYIIYNTIGQNCKHGNLFQSQIEINQLTPGMYTIQLAGPKGLTSHKLIVK